MSLKLGALALLAGAALFISPTSASADVIRVQIGVPPPPPPVVIERPWAPPYRTAVWIKPHYEAVHGRWVWVRGYYAYPPRVGAYWVEGRYNSRGYWRPGHWAW